MMIETERLIIRPFHEGDRKSLVSLLQDSLFMAFSAAGPFDAWGAHKRFDEIVSHSLQGLGKQAILLRESQQVIGYCGVEPFLLNHQPAFELGYRLVAAERGKGFATESVRAVLAHTKLSTLYAYVEELNAQSIRVLMRTGFVRHGLYHDNTKTYALFIYQPKN